MLMSRMPIFGSMAIAGSLLLLLCGAGMANAQNFAVVSIDLNEVSDVYCFNFALSYPESIISGVHVDADEDPDAFLGGPNPFEGCTECEFPKLDLVVNESVVGPTVWRCDIDGNGSVDGWDVTLALYHVLWMPTDPYEVSIANARVQPAIETDEVTGEPLTPAPLDAWDVTKLLYNVLFMEHLDPTFPIHIPKSPIVLGRDMGDRVNVIFSGWVPFNGPGTVMEVTFNVVPGETPTAEDFEITDFDVSIVDPVGCADPEPYDCGSTIPGSSLTISGVELK